MSQEKKRSLRYSVKQDPHFKTQRVLVLTGSNKEGYNYRQQLKMPFNLFWRISKDTHEITSIISSGIKRMFLQEISEPWYYAG